MNPGTRILRAPETLTMQAYSFDNAWSEARQRLRGLEQLLDPGSIRYLEALGVGQGWRCLEVGAGAGSMTKWLCQRVGPSGHELTTDLDTRLLAAMSLPNLEVRRHDIATQDLAEHGFDLVLSEDAAGAPFANAKGLSVGWSAA